MFRDGVSSVALVIFGWRPVDPRLSIATGWCWKWIVASNRRGRRRWPSLIAALRNQARIPVTKFVHSGVNCDLSSINALGLRNSQLLRHLQTLDGRVRPLFFFLKSWSRTHRFKELGLSSYALILMAVFFLQQVTTPEAPISRKSLLKGTRRTLGLGLTREQWKQVVVNG